MINYWIISLGRSGLMARFDDEGRLVEWTPRIRRASIFMTAEAGNAAIRSICRDEIAKAVASGRAVRELDEETGETIVMDYSRHRARALPTPRIGLSGPARSLDHDDEGQASGPTRRTTRRFVRGEFKVARRNPTRAGEALFGSRDAQEEYTTPTSRQGRVGRMMAHVPGA